MQDPKANADLPCQHCGKPMLSHKGRPCFWPTTRYRIVRHNKLLPQGGKYDFFTVERHVQFLWFSWWRLEGDREFGTIIEAETWIATKHKDNGPDVVKEIVI